MVIQFQGACCRTSYFSPHFSDPLPFSPWISISEIVCDTYIMCCEISIHKGATGLLQLPAMYCDEPRAEIAYGGGIQSIRTNLQSLFLPCACVFMRRWLQGAEFRALAQVTSIKLKKKILGVPAWAAGCIQLKKNNFWCPNIGYRVLNSGHWHTWHASN